MKNESLEKEMPSHETLDELVRERIARRTFLTGALSAVPLAAAAPLTLGRGDANARPERSRPDGLRFEPISLSRADTVVVPRGYRWRPLLRWGDALTAGLAPFDVDAQTPEDQALRVGYNCDFLGFFTRPHFRSQNPNRALLTINHEFTNPELMFPGYLFGSPTRAQVDVELAAHGLTVVELKRREGEWRPIVGSAYNRRITGETVIRITGPAAGHHWLKTSHDPTGTRVRGMLNNCGGGKTPWGTLLTCEENFNQYFANLNALPSTDPRHALHVRYGLPAGASERRWELFHDRFDLAKEPNEPFRFGWVVEIDPYDPEFVPRKRTALGRLKHEAATVVESRAGHAVVYTGDDERFDYMYKFVSHGRVSRHREENLDLLNDGILYVAKFHADGAGVWLPILGGVGPLAGMSQAEVLIHTRGAADLLGATKMDRPEDIETNPVTGKVYCVMTNNSQRGTPGRPGVDAANPRAVNRTGHIIEITEAYGDHASTSFNWDIFLLCGDPAIPEHGAWFAGFDTSKVSPIASPDNIVFDNRGNLWIATDGQPSVLPGNDGFFAAPVQGDERGYVQQLVSGPAGCEIACPEFADDDTALFLSIQHPGEGSTLASPSSTFPDGEGHPPRPTVVVVTKNGPGSKVIGR